jgi:hypothetical protein
MKNFITCVHIIKVIKSRSMRWAGHVKCMEMMRIAYKILVAKTEGRRPLRNLGVNARIILKCILKR